MQSLASDQMLNRLVVVTVRTSRRGDPEWGLRDCRQDIPENIPVTLLRPLRMGIGMSPLGKSSVWQGTRFLADLP